MVMTTKKYAAGHVSTEQRVVVGGRDNPLGGGDRRAALKVFETHVRAGKATLVCVGANGEFLSFVLPVGALIDVVDAAS
jgi:hypothetical protein